MRLQIGRRVGKLGEVAVAVISLSAPGAGFSLDVSLLVEGGCAPN